MIRLYEDSDLKDVIEIEKVSFVDPWSISDFIFFSSYEQMKLYVYVEEKIEGYIGLAFVDDRLEITNIAVAPNKRRLGIGEKLIEFAKGIAITNKLRNITLEVRVSNDKAIALYEKMGFKKLAVRKNYYITEDGYLMGIDL